MYLYVHYNKKKKLATFQPFKLVSFYRLGVWVGWEGWGWGGVKNALLFAAITGFRGFFFCIASHIITVLRNAAPGLAAVLGFGGKGGEEKQT